MRDALLEAMAKSLPSGSIRLGRKLLDVQMNLGVHEVGAPLYGERLSYPSTPPHLPSKSSTARTEVFPVGRGPSF